MSQQINLFNPIFMKQRKYFSLLAMLQALGMIILGSLVLYAYAYYQVGQMGRQLEENTKRYNAEQQRLARFAADFSPQQSGKILQDAVQLQEKKLAEQKELNEKLKSVGNTTGYSEYMRAFSRQVVQGLWLTGFKVAGDGDDARISLSGAVVDPELLPIYIQRLSRESIMHGKTFSTLKMQQSKQDENIKAGQTPAARRFVEFSLYSSPDNEAAK